MSRVQCQTSPSSNQPSSMSASLRRTDHESSADELAAQQWVTVDSIADEEDGGLSFVSGEPFPRPPTLRSRQG
jgi:hypothetical protein